MNCQLSVFGNHILKIKITVYSIETANITIQILEHFEYINFDKGSISC